jgi:C1A family cysteine protease
MRATMKTSPLKIVLFFGLLILSSMLLCNAVSASDINNSQINNTGTGSSAMYSGTSNPIRNISLNITYPSSFDLRSTDKVTSVKDQGNAGDCWVFGTIGSLESNLLPYEYDDFSENNMKNILNNYSPTGFDFTDGGTYDMALAYLAGWEGPVNESQDPYNDNSVYSPNEVLSPVKHVQDTLILPSRINSLDNNYIKWALMNYGAVATYMYINESFPYYNGGTYSYYYNGADGINHAVDIVGWNDNYDKNNFGITPAGNGAFIVKNSWGSNWGDNGYFYISYYDTELGIGKATGGSNSPNFVFIDAENTSNYNKNYQYDPYGWVSSKGYSSNTGWFSNIFTSTGNDILSAASFYVCSPNSTYNLYMYLNPLKNNPMSGNLVANLTGTLMSGYWTINLASPVNIVTGELFSVVVKLTTPGCNYPIPIEYAMTGYSSRATSQPGESYISSNGLSWTDAHKYLYNVCLKAFTSPNIIKPTKLTLNTVSGVKGELIKLTAILTNSYNNQPLNGKTIKFYLNGINIGSAITDLNGEAILDYILNDNAGIYQILAIFNGDNEYNSSNITSTLTIIDNIPPTITIDHVGGLYNTIQTIHLTTTDTDSTAITYYTTDGSNPQSSNTRQIYNGTGITITNTTTLLYTAVDPANNWGPIYTQTYTIDTTPPTATATPIGGLYNSYKNVTLTMSENGTIYYTTNGTTPTTTSTKYSTSILISSTKALKYLAIDLAGNISPVYNQTYTIDKTAPTASATPIGGTYNNTQSITLKMSESGTIYYTLNNTTPTTSSSKYSKPLVLSSNKTLKYFAMDLAKNKSIIYTQIYKVNDITNPTVTASLLSGYYNTTKTVTLKLSEPGTIYFTLNGTTPTKTSTIYSAPLNITKSCILKYFALDNVNRTSPIYTQHFIIDKVAPLVSSTSPVNNVTGVSLTRPITIKFSENIIAGANYGNIYIKNLTTGLIVGITKTTSGNILTILMTSKRIALNTYQVYIPAGAIKDKAGNKLITTYTFKFKTI